VANVFNRFAEGGTQKFKATNYMDIVAEGGNLVQFQSGYTVGAVRII
jgi:hypothetical protein